MERVTYSILWRALQSGVAAICLAYPASTSADTPPAKVGYMYSAYGNNTFANEWDGVFTTIGWTKQKFLNTNSAAFDSFLVDGDVLVVGSVGNLDHTVNFSTKATALQAYLNRGGLIVTTDANYTSTTTSWASAPGADFALSLGGCAPYTGAFGGSREETFINHPLTTNPVVLSPLFQGWAETWQHLGATGGNWTNLATCADSASLLKFQVMGKGLDIVTTHQGFNYPHRWETGKALLTNAWRYTLGLRNDLVVQSVSTPAAVAPGVLPVSYTLENRRTSARTITLSLRRASAPTTQIADKILAIPASSTVTDSVLLDLKRGRTDLVTVLMEDGAELYRIDGTAEIPLAAEISLPRPILPVSVAKNATFDYAFAPDLFNSCPGLEATVFVDGVPAHTFVPQQSSGIVSFDLSGISPGDHSVILSLSGSNRLTLLGTSAQTSIKLIADPVFVPRPDGVLLKNGVPFFPMGIYHLTGAAGFADLRYCMDEISAAGFNFVDASYPWQTGTDGTSDWSAIMDYAASKNLFVLTEFSPLAVRTALNLESAVGKRMERSKRVK